MMSTDAIYPEGFHPRRPTRTYDAKNYSKQMRRRDVASKIKYYFIDFGISSHFEDDTRHRMVTGIDGLDRDVPELHENIPYDPFSVDIFILGNVYMKKFLQVRTTPKQNQHALTSAEQEFENVSFLKPLVDIMTAKEPSERPTAQGALDMFHIIVKAQSGFSLRWRLRSTNEPVRTRILGDIDSVNCEVRYLMCTCNELLFGKCVVRWSPVIVDLIDSQNRMFGHTDTYRRLGCSLGPPCQSTPAQQIDNYHGPESLNL